MNRTGLFFLLLFCSISTLAQKIVVSNLLCNNQAHPIGVDDSAPRFSWQIKSAGRNSIQTAYRIIVADDAALLNINKGNICDSKKVRSDQSVLVPLLGKKLEPLKTYYWKVMIWDNKGGVSEWSHRAYWQMGLLSAAEWMGAKWIGYEQLPDTLHVVPFMEDAYNKRWDNVKDVLPLLRKEFQVQKRVKKAIACISGLGQFELYVNGKKTGDHFLDPGWTKYDKQALYVTFNITRQVKKGTNALGVMLGNGFYFIPGERYRKMAGAFGYPKMICRITVQYEDGTMQNIVSDSSWKTAPGPITFSSIYGGEDYDANLEKAGWDTPGYNDSGWKPAVAVSGPPLLDAQVPPPLKVFEHFKSIKISQPEPGVWVYDMGQNASGIPEITVKGHKGGIVKISPAELLNDDGLVTTKPVGSPVYFNYTLKGNGTETWHPRFMYYGFRYVQIQGAVPQGRANTNNLPVVIDLQSLHTRSAATRAGGFSCSNALFNKTFYLIDWAIQSNMASILTDCPHREKLGWLEEAHLMGGSVRYNFDIANLCRKIISDMGLSQTTEGLVPDIAPEYVQFGSGFRDSPEWGSSSVLLPWYVYEWYGDKQVLDKSYDMMCRYVAYLDSRATNHILAFGLGDWYDIGPDPPGVSQLTPAGLTATAIYYHDLTIMAKVAKLLNKPADEANYTRLSAQVRIAFNQNFYHTATKQYGTGSQTANAMAVYMGLVEPRDKEAVIDHIISDIRSRNNSLTAGDIGFDYLLRVLDEAGRADVINDMNNRTDVPGYGYQLTRGATALTESWQGARNASNNHFMLGHLMEWFYSGLAGIKPAPGSVAFHQIVIKPEPVQGVTYARATYRSPYGLISSDWKQQNGKFYLKVQIPPNTTATVYLPARLSSVIMESGRLVSTKIYKKGRAIFNIGSGRYLYQAD